MRKGVSGLLCNGFFCWRACGQKAAAAPSGSPPQMKPDPHENKNAHTSCTAACAPPLNQPREMITQSLPPMIAQSCAPSAARPADTPSRSG